MTVYWGDLQSEEISGEGTLHLAVANRSALLDSDGKCKEKLLSNVKEFGGCKWRLEISENPDDPNEYPWLNLLCNDGDAPRDRLWFCRVEVMLTVLGKNRSDGGGTEIVIRDEKKLHFFTSNTREFLDTVREELLNEKVPVEFIVEVKVAKIPPNVSAYLPALETTLTVLHQNKSDPLPVNKEQLMNYSSFFRNLFGNGSHELALNDTDEEFEMWRDVLYSTLARQSIVDYKPDEIYTLESVLQLAKNYDLAEKFAAVVEQDLLTEKNKERIDKVDPLTMSSLLKLAEQYGMDQLRDLLVEKQDVSVFAENQYFSMENAAAFSKSTLQALQKKVKEYAEEMTNVEQKLGKMMIKE